MRIRDSVVVITGASSGIGRATAAAFARRGANVVLAARAEGPLEDTARECERLGGHALAVPTDVTNPEAVHRLAEQAVERFGRIDVWINDAAVTLFGPFEEIPLEEFRRVIDTNLFGYVYGARAALPRFRNQGHGVLINISSVVGTMGQPFTSAYVAAKWAIIGLSESLRQELLDAPGIHVCVVLPPSVDTPLFQHGANYTGRSARAMPPVYPASRVAEAIVHCAMRPREVITVGGITRFGQLMHALLPPRVFDRAQRRNVERGHFQQTPAGPTQGNLYDPMPDTDRVSGGWGQPMSLQTLTLMGLAALSLLMLARQRTGLRPASPRGTSADTEEQIADQAVSPT